MEIQKNYIDGKISDTIHRFNIGRSHHSWDDLSFDNHKDILLDDTTSRLEKHFKSWKYSLEYNVGVVIVETSCLLISPIKKEELTHSYGMLLTRNYINSKVFTIGFESYYVSPIMAETLIKNYSRATGLGSYIYHTFLNNFGSMDLSHVVTLGN